MRKPDDEKVRQAFAAVLKDLRDGAGMSQPTLARKTGIEQSALARLETAEFMGRVPVWLALCKALGVSFHDVVKAAEEKLRGKPGLTVMAVDPEQRELLKIHDTLTSEGRRVLLDNARACLKLFRK